MMLRYVMGRTFARQAPEVPADATPAGPAVVKLDVEVEVVSVDDVKGVVVLRVPPYDLAKYNRLSVVRAYLVPVSDPAPATADDFVASAYPFVSEDVSAIQTGGEGVLQLPVVPAGDYVGQLVLGFEVA